MTTSTGGVDVGSVIRAMSEANVQFVVVGEPATVGPLRLVVSRHPTNLDALGRALDRLESSVRPPRAVDTDEGAPDRAASPRRVGDPMGTIAVETSAGDVDLLFGGARRSLYAEVVLRAEERELGGRRVQWAAELPVLVPPAQVTSRVLSRRLLSLAEGIAHLVDRHEAPADGEADGSADGQREGGR